MEILSKILVFIRLFDITVKLQKVMDSLMKFVIQVLILMEFFQESLQYLFANGIRLLDNILNKLVGACKTSLCLIE
jgi:hypothetical protein